MVHSTNHPMASLLLVLLALELAPTRAFLPSRPTTARTKNPATFRFYASGRQRKIHISVDQQISIRRAVQGEDDAHADDALEVEVGKDDQLNQESKEHQEPQVERRRKRDILKRTFGIGISNPATSKTDNPKNYKKKEEEIVFRKAGEMPNFLTPQDEEHLNATFSAFREERMREMEGDFKKGEFGPNITMEEATKIVDYAVETELKLERENLNKQRSMEALEQYNEDAQEMEERMIADILSEGEDKILENDAIVREIITDVVEREQYEEDFQKKVDELKAYEKDSEKEQQLLISTTKKILDENPDSDLDFNAVYDQVVAGIQNSRREKLSGPTFGVLGNSIELEQAREYGIEAREDQKQERAAREEALEKGYCDEEGLEDFFKEPTEVVEIKAFQSIVRSIIDQRSPTKETVEPESRFVSDDGDEDGEEDEDDDDIDYDVSPRRRLYEAEQAKAKWTLSPSEKVEAFRLLNQWREFQNDRDQAIKTEGERPTNKIKPLFLYREDSERTKQWENVQLEKALKLTLQTDDHIEKASSALLMRELLEGRNTKEKALRLVDTLIKKATDAVIKDALIDMKTYLLEMEETEEDDAEAAPERPLFVDLSKVFVGQEDDIEPQMDHDDDSQTKSFQENQYQKQLTQSIGSQAEDEEEGSLDKTVARPRSDFFTFNLDKTAEANRSTTTSELFGSYEEQLFDRFATKTGATTEDEKAELKRNLDEINALRSKVLSDVENEDTARERVAKLGVDVNTLSLEEESTDQFAALLEKRPVVSPKQKPTDSMKQKPMTEAATPTLKPKERQHEIVVSSGAMEEIDDDNQLDIISARYRALTGGETEDEDEYREFLMQEEEMRKKLEDEPAQGFSDDIDIDTYGNDAMLKMKPRPQAVAEEEGEEENDLSSFISPDDINNEISKLEATFDDDAVIERNISPDDDGAEWLELEQDSRGNRRKNLNNDDDFDSLERQQRIEDRQRLADEYLEKTSGGIIDMAEVLDRPYFGSMDEPDDYKKKLSTFSNYEGRKDELMEYTTLTVEDIINFVAWKQDPALSGVNQQLLQVQKPMSEYGALFRLEGCVVDLFGLQAKTWPKVAEKFGYTMRSEDDVKKASLYSPAKAIHVVFGWTDDVIEVDEIVKAYRSEFDRSFNAWLGNDSAAVDKTRPSQDEIETTYTLMWNKLAREKGQTPPTKNQVIEVHFADRIRDPVVAVRDILGWNEYSTKEIIDIVREFGKIEMADLTTLYQKYGLDPRDHFENRKPDVVLLDGFTEWLDKLDSVDIPFAIMSHLERSQLDAILDATGLADYFPPEMRVSLDENYSDERSELLGAALRVEKHPEKCIVFDNSPSSADVAHQVLMKCISFVNQYAKYELAVADWVVAGYRYLDLSLIRTLFSGRTDDIPLAMTESQGDLRRRPPTTKTSFWDD